MRQLVKCLVLCCFLMVIVTANVEAQTTSKAANLKIEGAEWRALLSPDSSVVLPSYLRGVKVHQWAFNVDPDSGFPSGPARLDFAAESDGWSVIACTWPHELEPRMNVFDDCQSRSDLIQQGWEPFGRITMKDAMGVAEYTLLRKRVSKGDQITLKTHLVRSPMAFQLGERLPDVLRQTSWKKTLHAMPRLRADSGAMATSLPAHTVPLLTHDVSMSDDFARTGVLIRELFRQALLIAARDELQLPTRDQSLRELMSGSASVKSPSSHVAQPLTLLASVNSNSAVRITVARTHEKPAASDDPADRFQILWEETRAVPQGLDLKGWARLAESLSRQELRSTLTRAGFTGRANRWSDDAGVPEEISRLLADLHFVSAFDAVRRLHGLIRESGESPARLAALSLGYANLGSLCEPFWSPARKAFLARAMLYASRLAVRHPQHPDVMRMRAYVWAMTGHHRLALDELADANEAGDQKSLGFRTDWVPLLSAFCRFDRESLSKVADVAKVPAATPEARELADLASYLRLLLEDGYRMDLPRQRAALSRLEQMPDCVRSLELLASVEKLGTNRPATEVAAFRLPPVLYRRIHSVAGISPVVQKHLEETPDPDENWASEIARRADLIAMLRAQGGTDTAEPSWTCLGQLVNEMSFLHAWRYLQFEAKMLGVDTAETHRTLRPVLDLHPYAKYADAWDRETRDRTLPWNDLTERFDLHMADNSSWPLVEGLIEWNSWQPDPQKRPEPNPLLRCFQDESHQDVARRQMPNTPNGVTLAELSPNSPFAAATRVEREWPNIQQELRQWEERYANEPLLLFKLQHMAFASNRREDGLRILVRLVEVSPETAFVTKLAEHYEQRGDTAKWLETLQAFLKTPETGLAHSQVRVRIARHFMRVGDFKTALPYADEAAESFAQWALACAAECHEGLGEMAQAEQLWRAIAGRYPGSAPEWFYFGFRTGEGDRQAQRQAIEAWIEERNRRFSPNDILEVGFIDLLRSDVKQAQKFFAAAGEQQPSKLAFLMAALQADALKLPNERDALLRQALAASVAIPGRSSGQFEFDQLTQMLQTDLQSGGSGRLDAALIDKLITTPKTPTIPTHLAYFAGQYLVNRGQTEAGHRLLRFVATSPYFQERVVTLARHYLRTQKVEFGPPRLPTDEGNLKR